MATLRLRGLRKSYGDDVDVIKGVDLDINDRDFVVFVGPSGCGKSTLMRMIAGLEEITSGDLMIDGERVNDVPPAERGLAMVFQSYALYPHMTVRDNMGFALRLAGTSPRPSETRRSKSRGERPATRPPPRSQAQARSPAASGSGWRSVGRSSASPRCSSSTSRSRTSTPRCASRCGSSSRGFTMPSKRR